MKKTLHTVFFFAGISIALFVLLYCGVLLAQTFGSLQRVSGARVPGQPGSSLRPVLSANGRYLAFDSAATNLVEGDFNDQRDVFLRDLSTNELIRVSVGPGGIEGDNVSENAAISPVAPNGFVALAFESKASTLVQAPLLFPDTLGFRDIYFSIPSSNLTERVSFGVGLQEANGDSFEPSITIVPEPNRAYIAFSSDASNLVSGDNNGQRDIFLTEIFAPATGSDFDIFTDVKTEIITKDHVLGGGNGPSGNPKLSGNGRYVVYESEATNLVGGISPVAKQIYLYDSLTKATSLVSKSAQGLPGNQASSRPAINFRGTFIVYLTFATNILADGIEVPTGAVQVVRHNIETGVSERVNVSSAGAAGNGTDASSLTPFISPNGRGIFFSDTAGNLVSNDLNGVADVFYRDMDTGEIVRLSTNSSGVEGDGPSLAPGIASDSYTSTEGILLFQSAATNLIENDTEDKTDVFVNSFGVDIRAFSAKTSLEVPPDISGSGRSISCKMEKFSGVVLNTAEFGAAKKVKPKLSYTVEIRKEKNNGKLGPVQRQVSKKNSVTFKRLPAGTYQVAYRAEAKRGTKAVRKSNLSPTQRIKVGG